MNICGMHICMDEIRMVCWCILAGTPAIVVLKGFVKSKIRNKQR